MRLTDDARGCFNTETDHCGLAHAGADGDARDRNTIGNPGTDRIDRDTGGYRNGEPTTDVDAIADGYARAGSTGIGELDATAAGKHAPPG
ncbi:hypothetical protein LBMAG38_15300 [Chloroflexota bacterium]|nr:hypothetical protein LBMAG38_15300 [Chloroflexota bacterium]